MTTSPTHLAPKDGSPEGTLSRTTVESQVVAVIAHTKGIEPETVRPDSTLEALGIDSLDRLNILFDLESTFDVSINDEEARQVRTVEEMISGIISLLAGKRKEGSPRANAAADEPDPKASNASSPTAGGAESRPSGGEFPEGNEETRTSPAGQP